MDEGKIVAFCPKCHARFRIAKSTLDRTRKCRKCGATMKLVPSSNAPRPNAPRQPKESGAQNQGQSQTRAGQNSHKTKKFKTSLQRALWSSAGLLTCLLPLIGGYFNYLSYGSFIPKDPIKPLMGIAFLWLLFTSMFFLACQRWVEVGELGVRLCSGSKSSEEFIEWSRIREARHYRRMFSVGSSGLIWVFILEDRKVRFQSLGFEKAQWGELSWIIHDQLCVANVPVIDQFHGKLFRKPVD